MAREKIRKDTNCPNHIERKTKRIIGKFEKKI